MNLKRIIKIVFDIVWYIFYNKVAPTLVYSRIETTAFLIISFLFAIIALAISFLIITIYYSLYINFVKNEIRNNIKYQK